MVSGSPPRIEASQLAMPGYAAFRSSVMKSIKSPSLTSGAAAAAAPGTGGADKGAEIYAVKSIFLGKKCYIDVLETLVNGKKKRGYHIRMKGVNLNAIQHYCYKNKTNEYNTYKKLYKGKELTFDLACGGDKCRFEKNRDMSIGTCKSFPRVVSF